MFSPAGRSDVTQTVMSAFSIKRTLDLIVHERLLSSESGHSIFDNCDLWGVIL